MDPNVVPHDNMIGTIITNVVLTITIKAGLHQVIGAVILIIEGEVIPTTEAEAIQKIGVEDIPITVAEVTLTIEVADIQITVAETTLAETHMEIEETIIVDHQIIIEVVEAIASQVE